MPEESKPQNIGHARGDGDTSKSLAEIIYNPLTGEEFIPEDIALQAGEQLNLRENADRKMNELLEEGWRWQKDVARDAGINYLIINSRNYKIADQKNYLPNGEKPTGKSGEIIIKGSDLRWQHPFNSAMVLMNPKYAATTIAAEEQFRKLKQENYVLQSEVSNETNRHPLSFATNTAKIESDQDYLITGLPPSGKPEEVTVKGSTLRWQHPFNPGIVLLHPDYVLSMIYADEKQIELEGKGYLKQPQVADSAQMKRQTLIARTRKSILEDGDYLPNGQEPTGKSGEITVKGSVLRWQHPYNQDTVLLSPAYAKGIIAAEDKVRDLKAKKYEPQIEIAKQLPTISVKSFGKRNRNIDPEGDYLPNGHRPTGVDKEVTIKGSELRWIHPYDFGTILLSPSFVQGIKEAEATQAKLISNGYKLQSVVKEEALLVNNSISQRTKSISPKAMYLTNGNKPKGVDGEEIIAGEALCWQHPFSNKITLLHPAFAKSLIDAETTKIRLIADGYIMQRDAIDITGMSQVNLAFRTRKIDPNRMYLTNGKNPSGYPKEKVIEGNLLRWQHPHDNMVVLLHPDYVAALTQEQAAKRSAIIQKDAGTENLGEVEQIAPDLQQALDEQRNAANKGKI